MKAHVLLVDDDASIRFVLRRALEKAGLTVHSADSGAAAQQVVQREPAIGAILSDIRMPDGDGMAFLAYCQQHYPAIPVIIMTAHSDLDAAVAAYQGGAFEYLPKPFDLDEAVATVQRALAQQASAANVPPESSSSELIGSAPAMQAVFRAIGRLARTQATVLINGESGTGKELIARALHRHSPRAGGPFVALNMAAIPGDLLGSELFGHERGAFTGANERRIGRFEQADGGTLFLDEIGDMPLDTQTQLLRVLSEGTFYRVGGTTALNAQVRIIAATHQDLSQRVVEGRFREDLFHRLNVVRLHLPRLADRREDVPALARHFLQQAAAEMAVDGKTLSPEAEQGLVGFDWPGNVRQLENTCRWLTVMASGSRIELVDLPEEITKASPVEPDWQQGLRRWAEQRLATGASGLYDEALPVLETILLQAALAHSGGKKLEAAQLLGWGRNTLTRKLGQLLNDKPDQD